MSVSKLGQSIYNAYLKSLANAKDEPYVEGSFEDALSHKEQLEQLSDFFMSHSHINVNMFMDAPHRVYSDDSGYSLSFYSTPIALKTYFMYLNLLQDELPDFKYNLMLIKDGLQFIKNFCVEKNIPLRSYLGYSDSATYSWCMHVLNKDITIYNILGFSNFGINIYMLLNQIPNDEKSLFLNPYYDNISEYIKRLQDSKKANVLLLRGIKKIKKIIEEELTLN